MKERPILMSALMVRALLAGTKTQTRRIVKWRGLAPGLNLGFSGLRAQTYADGATLYSRRGDDCWEERTSTTPCPYGQPGDRLWVRESHAFSVVDPEGRDWREDPENWDVIYRADDQPSGGWVDADGNVVAAPWRFSIHMPRWASRITLEITDVRVERLQRISEADAKAEGVSMPDGTPTPPEWWSYRREYAHLWDRINGAGSWDANPWVWAISFHSVIP